MCRLYGFRANEPTKVECTLVRAQNALLFQSQSDATGRAHSDGWGVGFYENSSMHVEKAPAAASHGLHFSVTAERVYARTVLAHIRRATVGRPADENTHPFRHGTWLFAHNGSVAAFDQVRPELERETERGFLAERLGDTDSELVFYWLLTRMKRAGIRTDRACSDVHQLAELVGDAIHELASKSTRFLPDNPGRLNFLLTDGDAMIASRWRNTLYWVLREGVRDCEICNIPHVHHDEGRDYRAVVIASEPITHEVWNEIPEDAVLAVDRDLAVVLKAESPA